MEMDSNFCDFDLLYSQNDCNTCQYYTAQEFASTFLNSCTNNSGANQDIENKSDNLSFLHINSRSIPKNFDSIQTLLLSLKRFTFSIIGICETWLNENSPEIYSRLQNDKK